MAGLAHMITHRCPIEPCGIELPGQLVMCAAHWRLVPKPIQSEVYVLCRRRRGSPAHKGAVRRAIESVRKAVDGRDKRRAETRGAAPGWLPYRDD